MQFLLGLAAGILVGLIMEWMIDWGSLFQVRSSREPKQARQDEQNESMSAPRNPASADQTDFASAGNNIDSTMSSTTSSTTQHAHGE